MAVLIEMVSRLFVTSPGFILWEVGRAVPVSPVSSLLSLAIVVGIWMSVALRMLCLRTAHIVHIVGLIFKRHCLGSLSAIDILVVARLLVSSSPMLGLEIAIAFSASLLFVILSLLAMFRVGTLAQLA